MEPDGSALQHASTGALVGFAIAMGAPALACVIACMPQAGAAARSLAAAPDAHAAGLVHVLTGPDHLTAVSMLAAGGGASRWRAAWLGVRWGLGHRRVRTRCCAHASTASHTVTAETRQ
jgi:hypothetical protein